MITSKPVAGPCWKIEPRCGRTDHALRKKSTANRRLKNGSGRKPSTGRRQNGAEK